MALRRPPATLAGILSIAFWSTSVAFSRDLTEQLGTFTATAAIYLPAGLLGTLALALSGRLGAVLRLPRAYLLGCGALFVAYLVPFSVAIGLCRTPSQVVEIGLINYLWPALTLVLSVPLLGNRARIWLPAGVLVALAGVALASRAASPEAAAGAGVLAAAAQALRSLGANAASNPWPYALVVFEIVAWAVYSNLASRLAPDSGAGAVPLFVLAAGVVLALVRLGVPETGSLSAAGAAELAFMALFPGLLAYVFWEMAMRGPGMVLVTSLSYLIPLFSTLLTAWRQGVPFSTGLLAACALVIGGAVLCRLGVRPAKPAEAAVATGAADA